MITELDFPGLGLADDQAVRSAPLGWDLTFVPVTPGPGAVTAPVPASSASTWSNGHRAEKLIPS